MIARMLALELIYHALNISISKDIASFTHGPVEEKGHQNE
jgi:hypothetical protein